MSASTMSRHFAPSMEITERSDGHLLPFLVGVAMFLVSAIASIMVAGLPH